MITTTFERHGITYTTTGTVGCPQSIQTANGTDVPLSGPLYFAAADALAKADRATWPTGEAKAPTPTPAPQLTADVDTLSKALERAKKLLRVTEANGATPAEAANAAARAQEIMDRFKLSAAGVLSDDAAPIESHEPIMEFSHDPLSRDTRLPRWKGWLALLIAEQNQCTVYASSGNLILIGRPSDVQICRYLFTWLAGEIERLASRDCKGCGISYWNNYRIGATETVLRRLREQHARTFESVRAEAAEKDRLALPGAQTLALTLVNQSITLIKKRAQEVKFWTEQNVKLRTRSAGRSAKFDGHARQAGRQAGESIQLGASGRLGAGVRPRLS